MKKTLRLLRSGIESKPDSVLRVCNSAGMNTAEMDQPVTYGVDSLLGRLESFRDLFGRPELAVLLRFWMGSGDT